MKPSFLAHQAHDELIHSDYLESLVREQYEEDQANLPPLSVEDWNAQYEQLMQELNEYLARELLESTA